MIRPILPVEPINPIRPITFPKVRIDILTTIIAPLFLLGLFVFVMWIMLKANEDKFKNESKLAAVLSTAGIGLIMILLFGASLTTVKGMILCLILMYASLSDIRFHEVPNFVWAMIGILAFVGFEPEDLPSMLIGAVAVFVPQLAVSIIKPNRAIGGADIKISTALAFMLGAEKGIFSVIVGMLAAVIGVFIARKATKHRTDEAFPLVPFLAAGAVLAFML